MAFVTKQLPMAVDVCKCRNPIPEPYEFKISDSSPILGDFIYPGIEDSLDFELLKRNIICEFNHILDQLECGIQPNLEILLEEISLINIYERFRVLFK